jgi:hypothetical protein
VTTPRRRWSTRSSGPIDLADAKRMLVVTDHESKILARKTFRCRAWDLAIAKSHAEVDLFGGHLGNYGGNVPSFDGGWVDNAFRWCDNIGQ